MLSKSKYTRGIKCPKSLWLYYNKKEEQVYSANSTMILSRGTDVGLLAQSYFPEGKLAVLEGEYPSYQTAKRTQEFIEQGVETIYEATFVYDDTLVAVDILHKENGSWHIYEVKSTNSTKPEHIIDVAVQYYVAKGSGLVLTDVSVMHFNNEYVRRGAIDVQGLFKADSVLEKALAYQPKISANLATFKQLVRESEEPKIEMGTQCDNPYECDFKCYCQTLCPKLEQTEEVLSSVPEIKENEVQNYVRAIKYPICHLDFETIMPGVPLFNESRPYQQITFQYSIHYQESKGGEIIHREYLAPSDINIDPRIGLIEQMIADTKDAKTIFMYTPFERTQINGLKRDFPQYAKDLDSILERLVDLIIPFRKKYYRTESMKNSASIKKVLPALCPDLSYAVLTINNGMDASNSFHDLYYCADQTYISETREHLLKYCHLDTLAMVKLWEKLEEI